MKLKIGKFSLLFCTIGNSREIQKGGKLYGIEVVSCENGGGGLIRR